MGHDNFCVITIFFISKLYLFRKAVNCPFFQVLCILMWLVMSAKSKPLKEFAGNVVTVSVLTCVVPVTWMISIHLIMVLIEWKLVENQGKMEKHCGKNYTKIKKCYCFRSAVSNNFYMTLMSCNMLGSSSQKMTCIVLGSWKNSDHWWCASEKAGSAFVEIPRKLA